MGGAELWPRWQNFRYLHYATQIAVLPAPALPPEHSKDGSVSHSTDSTFTTPVCALLPHCLSPRPSPPGRVTETPGGAAHFRRSMVPFIGCFHPNPATVFGLEDRLPLPLEAYYPARGFRWVKGGAYLEGTHGRTTPASQPEQSSEDTLSQDGAN